MYTVGPDYAHAEARKSPALDGKVERDSEGKEIRYPVMLTSMEKLVARKVCMAFKVSWLFLRSRFPVPLRQIPGFSRADSWLFRSRFLYFLQQIPSSFRADSRCLHSVNVSV